jgi:hypothetical protein
MPDQHDRAVDGLDHVADDAGVEGDASQRVRRGERRVAGALELSAGLVTDQAAGTRRVYSADPAGIAAIREYFEQFWQQSLASFRTAASQPIQEET